jgi:hypothetical protein
MTWAKWIFAYLFDCVHRHTTWPQRARTGIDYVCCLDCGKEFAYSTQLMCIVSKEDQLKDRSQYRWGTPRLMDSPPRSQHVPSAPRLN